MTRIILALSVLLVSVVYGGQAWDKIQQKVTEIVDPKTQKSLLFDSLKKKFVEIENVMQEVNENINNPEFEKKVKLEAGLKLIEESQNEIQSLEKIDEPKEGLIKKTLENLKDLKGGAANLLFPQSQKETPDCECPE